VGDKVLTLHPDPAKKGVNIDRAKYDLVREGIFDVLENNPALKPMQMFEANAKHLAGQMEGSIAWYSVTVKLDMEARGELTHDRKTGKMTLTGVVPNPPL